MTGSYATTTIDEPVTAQTAVMDSPYSSSAATIQSYHEQPYPKVAAVDPEPAGIQWLKEVSADPGYPEQSSESPEDPVSRVNPIVSDSDSVMTRNFASETDFVSETNPFALDSSSQSPEFTLQQEYVNGLFPDLGYELPIYASDDVDFQQTQQLYARRAKWLAKKEQISRDLGKSSLFSPSLVNCPVSSTATPASNDRFLRYNTSTSIHHPRPVESRLPFPNARLHPFNPL